MHSPPRLTAAGRQRAPTRPPSRGQALVEFALIAPVFLLLLVIALDFGRLFFTWIQVNNAAREAAAAGAYAPTDIAQMTLRANGEKKAQGQRGESAVTVSATCAQPAGRTIACTAATGGAGPGNTVTVRVRERFTFFTPIVGAVVGATLNLDASATSNVLGYAAGTGGSNPGSCSVPDAEFTAIVTSGRSIFADPSASTPNSGVCNISGYNWDWGDTKSEPGAATGNPHTYTSDGTFTITPPATNQAGPATRQHQVTITTGPPPPPTCVKPTATFTWATSGNGNKTYAYRDAST